MSVQGSGYSGLDRFDRVNATGTTGTLLEFLDRVEGLADVRARRHSSYERLGLRPGMAVGEVGCGAGTAARELAALVGPKGRVHGFDISSTLIDVALSRMAQTGVANVDFRAAAAVALPLPEAGLDAYRAERVFQHLAEPGRALAEAFRVLRPGGRVLVLDQDWDTLLFDGDLTLTRELTRAFADSLVSGTGAWRLRSQLHAAGFVDVEVAPDTRITADGHKYGWMVDTVARAAARGGIGEARARSWLDDQERRIGEDTFLMSVTHFVTVARRP